MNTQPCPKCGNQPNIYSVGDDKQFYVAKCNRCGYTPARPYEATIAILDAIKVWNKRYSNI